MAWQDYWSGERDADTDDPLVPEPNTGTPLNPAWLRPGQANSYLRGGNSTSGYRPPSVPGAGQVQIRSGPGPLAPSAEEVGNANLGQRRQDSIRKAREIASTRNPVRTDDTGGQLEDLVRYSTARSKAGLQEGQVHQLIDSLYRQTREASGMEEAQRAAKMNALRNQASEPSYQGRQTGEDAQWEKRHAVALAEQKAERAAAADDRREANALRGAERAQDLARRDAERAEDVAWRAQGPADARKENERQRIETEGRASQAKNDSAYEQALGLADFTDQLAAGGTDLARAGADDTREAIFRAAPLMARAREQAEAEYPEIVRRAEAMEAAGQKGSPEYIALAKRGAMIERVMRKAPAAMDKLSELRRRIEAGQRTQAQAAAAAKTAPREMSPEEREMHEARLRGQEESNASTLLRNQRLAGEQAAKMAAGRVKKGYWPLDYDWTAADDPQSQIEALLKKYTLGETLTPEEASSVRVYLQSFSRPGSPASSVDQRLENEVP